MLDKFIDDVSILEGYSEDGAGTPMTPKFLARPGSEEELIEIVKYAEAENLTVTPTGARTCDTASGLAGEGILVSFEKMKKILEVNEKELTCNVQPGIFLFDLKEELQGKGLFYPPDPSSEKIATLGGTVATNAAGARSFKYGQTARHISALRVVSGGGQVLEVSNSTNRKNTTGPEALHRPCDLFVGSEGILGLFSSIKLKLIRGVPDAFALAFFFDDLKDMHSFNVKVNSGEFSKISPRSVEFMDESCLNLLRESGKYPQVPAKGKAMVICEQEYQENEEELLLGWSEVLEKTGALTNDTIVANTVAKIQELRELRHHVPSTIWEKGKEVASAGGKKVSTDWAVPVIRFDEMMKQAEPICEKYGFPSERVYRYAHLGEGHPHYNFVPKDSEETKKCLELRRELSQLAVSLGGTVAGEHGVGKLRKDLFELEGERTELKVQMLRALKKEFDPKNIFSPGNLL